VPPSTTSHDPEPVASPCHLSARSTHAFAAGTPLSPATHNLDLTHPPWAAPVGRHGRGRTLPHSPATVPAREHPPTTHAPMDMYARCPVAVALGTWPFALPQTSTCTAPGTLARMAVHQHATAEAFLRLHAHAQHNHTHTSARAPKKSTTTHHGCRTSAHARRPSARAPTRTQA